MGHQNNTTQSISTPNNITFNTAQTTQTSIPVYRPVQPIQTIQSVQNIQSIQPPVFNSQPLQNIPVAQPLHQIVGSTIRIPNFVAKPVNLKVQNSVE